MKKKDEARKRLIARIEEAGISNVARALGASESKIQAWKKKEKPSFPRLDTLSDLDDVIALDWNYIIRGVNTNVSPSISNDTINELLKALSSLRNQVTSMESKMQAMQANGEDSK
jgi:transposase-like protein